MENSGLKRKSSGWIIEDTIICCICLDFLNQPVMQCINAHIICSTCLKKIFLSKCPICRADLNIKINNRLMDKVLGCYQMPCKFEGCNKLFSLTSIVNHQLSCIYNDEIQCPVLWADKNIIGGICSETFPLKRLDQHLKLAHKMNNFSYSKFIPLKFCDDLSLMEKPKKVVDSKYFTLDSRSILCSVLGDTNYCTIRIIPLKKDEKLLVRLSISQGEHTCIMEKNTFGLGSIFNHADFLLSYTACELYCIDNWLNCKIELVRI